MTDDPAIRMDGLTKHYPGVAARTDLSLDVPRGSIFGFLGPNGAGKTTALKVLAGLIRPTSGTAPRSRARRSPLAPPIAGRSATSPRTRASTTG